MSYDSRGSERGEGVSVGIQSAPCSSDVHVLKAGLQAEVPFVVVDNGVGEDRWAVKFARREEVSSVLDFSKVGRRITEGPPDMIFLMMLLAWAR